MPDRGQQGRREQEAAVHEARTAVVPEQPGHHAQRGDDQVDDAGDPPAAVVGELVGPDETGHVEVGRRARHAPRRRGLASSAPSRPATRRASRRQRPSGREGSCCCRASDRQVRLARMSLAPELLERFDLRDPAFIADPYPVFAELREAAPIFWYEPSRQWFLTRHSLVHSTLRDRRLGRAYLHRYTDQDLGRPGPDPRLGGLPRQRAVVTAEPGTAGPHPPARAGQQGVHAEVGRRAAAGASRTRPRLGSPSSPAGRASTC